MTRAALTISAAVLVVITSAAIQAQVPPAGPTAPASGAATGMAFTAFLSQVAHSNLELAAQRANVPIAEAQIAIARVFPDPVIYGGIASVDLSHQGAPLSTTLGVTVPIELGLKRGRRIDAATAQRIARQAELEDYLRLLRGTASNAYVDALHAQLILDRKRQTLADLTRLVGLNEERLRAGDVGEVAVLQSRVEARRFEGEVLDARGELSAANLALLVYLGAAGNGAPLTPAGDLRATPHHFDPGALIAIAQQQRPDARAARAIVTSSRAGVALARANRWIDLAVNVGWQHSFAASGPFNAPAYDTLGATVSVPVPISRIYRGELDAALVGVTQSEARLQGVMLRIEVEVRQALARYDSAVSRLGLYTGGLLADSERVLAATLFNYQRGGATLLEVLNSQRTVNELYLAYFDALADHAHGLIAVEQSVGMWDVTF